LFCYCSVTSNNRTIALRGSSGRVAVSLISDQVELRPWLELPHLSGFNIFAVSEDRWLVHLLQHLERFFSSLLSSKEFFATLLGGGFVLAGQQMTN
jgi:hypothetical protein